MRNHTKFNRLVVLVVIAMFVISLSGVGAAMSSEPKEEGTNDQEIRANEDGLIAHYPLDNSLEEITGNFEKAEVVGKQLDAQDSGSITYNEGIQEQAAIFNGQSGIRLPNDLITDDSYSVSIWLNPKEITEYTPAFFGAVPADDESQQWVSLVPKGPVGATMVWSGEEWYDAATDLTIPTDQWTHVAFTVNNGKIKLYLNGEEKFAGKDFPDVFSSEKTVFGLGVNYWDTPFKGMMDNL
ncbi:MAG: LamG domain-containing protein, partial [Bacillota bacterium]